MPGREPCQLSQEEEPPSHLELEEASQDGLVGTECDLVLPVAVGTADGQHGGRVSRQRLRRLLRGVKHQQLVARGGAVVRLGQRDRDGVAAARNGVHGGRAGQADDNPREGVGGGSWGVGGGAALGVDRLQGEPPAAGAGQRVQGHHDGLAGGEEAGLGAGCVAAGRAVGVGHPEGVAHAVGGRCVGDCRAADVALHSGDGGGAGDAGRHVVVAGRVLVRLGLRGGQGGGRLWAVAGGCGCGKGQGA